MDRDGAENAKAEIFQRAFGYVEVPGAQDVQDGAPIFEAAPDSAAGERIRLARQQRTLARSEQIAVGILRPQDADRRGRAAEIGLFVQRKRLVDHRIVEAARRIARDEVRIVITGPVRGYAANAGRCRPLRIGASVGHHRATAGTIGCFAVCRKSGMVGIVSNNHVLARSNQAAAGDDVLQPGRIDGVRNGRSLNRIASLGTFVPIDFAPNAPNYVDCAFAPLSGSPGHDGSTIGPLDRSEPDQPMGACEELIFDRIEVRKIGRTTGPTKGFVQAISVDNLTVQMETGPRPRYALFHRQIAITGVERRFSKPGDSGSLIYVKDGNPVGLLFAGAASGGDFGHGITFANPIQAVLDALEVDIYTGFSGGSHV